MRTLRALLPGLVCAALASGASGGSSPARGHLVVLTQEDCAACASFMASVAPIYPRTDSGRAAPLVPMTATEAREDGVAPPAVYPTFLLLDGKGREVARLEGFTDQQGFWTSIRPLLSEHLGVVHQD